MPRGDQVNRDVLADALEQSAQDVRYLGADPSPALALKVMRRLLRTVCRLVAELDDDQPIPRDD